MSEQSAHMNGLEEDDLDVEEEVCHIEDLPPEAQVKLLMLLSKFSVTLGEPISSAAPDEVNWMLPLDEYDPEDEILCQTVTLTWAAGDLSVFLDIRGDDPAVEMISIIGECAYGGIAWSIRTKSQRVAWAQRQDWSLPQPQPGETQEDAIRRRWQDLCDNEGSPYLMPPRQTPMREAMMTMTDSDRVHKAWRIS